MKKLIKGILITLVAVFALLGASTTALAASGYINWGGSEARNNLMITLEKIGTKSAETKAEKEQLQRSNEQLTNTVKDKENVIKDKENLLAGKQKELDELRKNATNSSDQLKQAETDMKQADQKATDVLNGMK